MMLDLGLMNWFTPGLIMIVAAVAVPMIRHHYRQCWILFAIALSALGLTAGEGVHWVIPVFGQELILHRADGLTLPFGIIFHIAAALNVLYGWHERGWAEHTAGLAYAGAAIAAVHAGDLLTLFIFWEATAVASAFILLSAGVLAVAMRYLLVQVASGVFLLAGASFYWHETGGWGFTAMSLDSLGTLLIFIAFAIKAAFPLLHNWLIESYPKASALGAVMLSAFTTKMAIYALARGFAGSEYLIPIGAVMVVWPLIFIVIENDLRRVLALSLASQLGFMTVAIGVGSELAINGVVVHAAAHILYKSVLFMAMGAVLLRAGTVRASALGGLYHVMPWTLAFCVIGVLALSAFPLLSSFVSKSLITAAVGYEGLVVLFLALLVASASIHAGIKLVYFPFFNREAPRSDSDGVAHEHPQGEHPQGEHPQGEAPVTMLMAMAVAAVLCVLMGVAPSLYYRLLPYPVDYSVYSLDAVLTQLQILTFAVLAFIILMRLRLYPSDSPSTLPTVDGVLRASVAAGIRFIGREVVVLLQGVEAIGARLVSLLVTVSARIPLGRITTPGPAAVVQLSVLILLMAVVYAVFA